MISSAHYAFERLTERVTFARARADGGALSNSAVIDLGGDTLVFDTGLTPQAAEDLRRVAAAVTGREPTLAANSHWHPDHVFGNQVFAAVPTYATSRTREILLERSDALTAENQPAIIERTVRELEAMARAAPSEGIRRYLESVLATCRWSLRAAAILRVTPPNQTYDDRLRLPGARSAELITFGGGHTESDALLPLPNEGVLIAGDLIVVETHANLTSGQPEQWLEILDRIEALGPERIVPGHGPVSPPEAIASVRDYLTTILSLSERTQDAEIPARFAGWDMPDQFEENLKFLRGRAIG